VRPIAGAHRARLFLVNLVSDLAASLKFELLEGFSSSLCFTSILQRWRNGRKGSRDSWNTCTLEPFLFALKRYCVSLSN
jgi:hypothetical protein